MLLHCGIEHGVNVSQDVSAACIYLVSKIGPLPRSPRDISNVYTYLLSESSSLFQDPTTRQVNKPSSYYQTETRYHIFQSRILALEARILYALSFDTHVSLSHPLAITYLQTLDFLSQPRLDIVKRTVEYLNTALLSPQMLYLTHQPHALATAAIYNAAKDLGAKMPDCAWWEVFDVDREELGFLVVGMRSLEGWVRRQRDALPEFGKVMITRRVIEEEMAKRGLNSGNGSIRMDEEDEMMRALDEKTEEITE
jgi:cyclin L